MHHAEGRENVGRNWGRGWGKKLRSRRMRIRRRFVKVRKIGFVARQHT
jgi:hypothetical protein